MVRQTPSFQAGVAGVDITPPVGYPLAGYAERTGPSRGIHTPLKAKVAIFDDGHTRAAIVTMDLITATMWLTQAIRQELHEKAGVVPECCLVCASHTHGSPDPRVHSTYLMLIAESIGGAAFVAADSLSPASLGVEQDCIDFSVNRRLVDRTGVARFSPNPAGVCDHRVKVVRVDGQDSQSPKAVLFHCCCHANVFRGENERITADFPGVAQAFIEHNYRRTLALFLQGCAGNLRCNLPGDDTGFRNGDDADMTWAGWSLGAAVVKATSRAALHEARSMRIAHPTIRGVLEVAKISGRQGSHVDCPLQVLRIGDIWFVGLPGEPFVEYGLHIEDALRGKGHVFVMECSSDWVGYIPTAEAFSQGGYEPSRAIYAPTCEAEILAAIKRLALSIA